MRTWEKTFEVSKFSFYFLLYTIPLPLPPYSFLLQHKPSPISQMSYPCLSLNSIFPLGLIRYQMIFPKCYATAVTVVGLPALGNKRQL